jgi:hypothetical protein
LQADAAQDLETIFLTEVGESSLFKNESPFISRYGVADIKGGDVGPNHHINGGQQSWGRRTETAAFVASPLWLLPVVPAAGREILRRYFLEFFKCASLKIPVVL